MKLKYQIGVVSVVVLFVIIFLNTLAFLQSNTNKNKSQYVDSYGMSAFSPKNDKDNNSKSENLAVSSAESKSVSASLSSKFTPVSTLKLPVIMFHHINDLSDIPASDKIGIGLRVSPKAFDKQLNYLKENKYTTINMDDLYDYSQGSKALPNKPILLTFDDGYKDSFSKALPILKKYNMIGDFAIITKVLGQNDYMTWDDVKAMKESGNSISSHTQLHCSLAYPEGNSRTIFRPSPIVKEESECPDMNYAAQMNTAQITGELKKSKEILEKNLGNKVRAIIYPFGHWNKQTEEIAKATGYSFGFTVIAQQNENLDLNKPFAISRYRANGQQTEDLQGFFAGAR